MKLLFKNNASSTLASGITASSTTLTLSAGTGSDFPAPTSGQGFYLTLEDASTQLVNEVMLCTARSSDVLTVTRGQQGTTAVAWNAGDIVQQLVTQGDMEGMIQPDDLQSNVYGAASSVGGTANSITATLTSGLTALVDMMGFTVEATAANTGAVTLTLTLGTTVLSAYPVRKFGGSALSANDIPAAGYPIEVVWSSTLGAYIMTNPATSTTSSIAGGAANQVVYQTAPGTTGFIAAPTVAGQVLAFIGGVIAWAAAAVTSFNGRSGAVVPATGDYSAAQVGAVPATAFQSPNIQHGNPMFNVMPDGNIWQGGRRSNDGSSITVTFPKAFPTACVGVLVSCNNQAAAIRVTPIDRFTFQYQCGGDIISWIAFGY